MNTRRKIEGILKSKGITAESITYDRSGPEDFSWWTVFLSPEDAAACREKLDEPELSRAIEFCDLEDGFLQLNELPSLKEPS